MQDTGLQMSVSTADELFNILKRQRDLPARDRLFVQGLRIKYLEDRVEYLRERHQQCADKLAEVNEPTTDMGGAVGPVCTKVLVGPSAAEGMKRMRAETLGRLVANRVNPATAKAYVKKCENRYDLADLEDRYL